MYFNTTVYEVWFKIKDYRVWLLYVIQTEFLLIIRKLKSTHGWVIAFIINLLVFFYFLLIVFICRMMWRCTLWLNFKSELYNESTMFIHQLAITSCAPEPWIIFHYRSFKSVKHKCKTQVAQAQAIFIRNQKKVIILSRR